MKKITIISLLFVVQVLSFRAKADNYFPSYQGGRTDFELSLNYFKSNSNFSSGGTKADLPAGNYMQAMDSTIYGRYVVVNDWAIFSNANISNAESSDSIATRTNSALNAISIGTDFQMISTNWFNLTAEFSYLQSLEKVKTDTDSVLNGDGANEAILLLGSTFNFDWIYPFFKGGIKYRTEGLSTLLVYTAGLETRNDGIALGGLLTGYSTIKNDDKTDQSYIRDTVNARVDAFSKKYNSTNPNLIDSEVYLKYNFSSEFSMKTFAGYTLAGSNAAAGYHVGAAIDWGFGSNVNHTTYSTSRKPVPKKTVPAKTGGFKEDTNDGVNQDYFKPVTPSKDEYIEQIEGSSKSLRNATEPEPQVNSPAKPEPFDSGYKIKLRKIKKKKKQ